MLDPRPVIYLIGMLALTLGALMLLPMAMDLSRDDPNWRSFALSGFATAFVGGGLAGATRNALRDGLGRRQSFLLASSLWLVLPAFAALPFMLGAPGASWTDAYFEALSGMTTTGTTVFVGLDDMPRGGCCCGVRSCNGWAGLALWWWRWCSCRCCAWVACSISNPRGLTPWGKVMPRVYDISLALLQVYLALTLAAIIAFMGLRHVGVRRAEPRLDHSRHGRVFDHGPILCDLYGTAGICRGGVHGVVGPALHPADSAYGRPTQGFVARRAGARLSALDRLCGGP